MPTKLMLLLLVAATSVAAAQTYSVLYSFGGTNQGYSPETGVVADAAGNLYGTTRYGGVDDFGTIFELPVTGGEKVLHHFSDNWDGAYPTSGLIVDDADNLYGTAEFGGYPLCGDIGCGLVFKLSPDGKFSALHIFKGGLDGGYPIGGLIRDGSGNLYGTTSGGGFGYGVIFRIDPTGHEKVLYKFTGAPDGSAPVTQLVRDSAGNLYGATEWGGNLCNAFGCGIVFKLDRSGKLTNLYSFTGGSDGGNPPNGALTLDAAGNLYGITQYGGDFSCLFFKGGCGVAYKLDPAGTETVLYTFHGGGDGAEPIGGLIRDTRGNLYGSTVFGGSFDGSSCIYGCGVVFEITPGGQETILHSFQYAEGCCPEGPLTFENGYLYGTASSGGANPAGGVAFQLKP